MHGYIFYVAVSTVNKENWVMNFGLIGVNIVQKQGKKAV